MTDFATKHDGSEDNEVPNSPSMTSTPSTSNSELNDNLDHNNNTEATGEKKAKDKTNTSRSFFRSPSRIPNLNIYGTTKEFVNEVNNHGVQFQLEIVGIGIKFEQSFATKLPNNEAKFEVKVKFSLKNSIDLKSELKYKTERFNINKNIAVCKEPIKIQAETYANRRWTYNTYDDKTSKRRLPIYSYSAPIIFEANIYGKRTQSKNAGRTGSSTLRLACDVGHHNGEQTIKLPLTNIVAGENILKIKENKIGTMEIKLKLHHVDNLETNFLAIREKENQRRRNILTQRLLIPTSRSNITPNSGCATNVGRILYYVDILTKEAQPLIDLCLYLSLVIKWKSQGVGNRGSYIASTGLMFGWYILTKNISYWPVVIPTLLFMYNRWYWTIHESKSERNATTWKDNIVNVKPTSGSLGKEADTVRDITKSISQINQVLCHVRMHWFFGISIVGVLLLIQIDLADEMISYSGVLAILSQEPNIMTMLELISEWLQRQKKDGPHGVLTFYLWTSIFVAGGTSIAMACTWWFGITSLLKLLLVPLFFIWDYGWMLTTGVVAAAASLWYVPVKFLKREGLPQSSNLTFVNGRKWAITEIIKSSELMPGEFILSLSWLFRQGATLLFLSKTCFSFLFLDNIAEQTNGSLLPSGLTTPPVSPSQTTTVVLVTPTGSPPQRTTNMLMGNRPKQRLSSCTWTCVLMVVLPLLTALYALEMIQRSLTIHILTKFESLKPTNPEGCCGPKSCMEEEAQNSKHICLHSEMSAATKESACFWLRTPGCCGVGSCLEAQDSEAQCISMEINATSEKSSCTWVGKNSEFWVPATLSEWYRFYQSERWRLSEWLEFWVPAEWRELVLDQTSWLLADELRTGICVLSGSLVLLFLVRRCQTAPSLPAPSSFFLSPPPSLWSPGPAPSLPSPSLSRLTTHRTTAKEGGKSSCKSWGRCCCSFIFLGIIACGVVYYKTSGSDVLLGNQPSFDFDNN